MVDEKEEYLGPFNVFTNNTDDTYEFVDIDSVSFLFNDRFLNTTIWLKSLDDLKTSNLSGTVKYGILLNSDLNSLTGLDGIDYEYQLMINSSNEDKIVTKELNEISNEGYKRQVFSDDINWTDFLDNNQNFINLDLDLKDLLNSQKYIILFYAIFEKIETNGNSPILFIDTTKRAHIPPPEVQVVFHENPIKIQIGSSKEIELTAISHTLSNVILQLGLEDFKLDFSDVSADFHDLNEFLGEDVTVHYYLSPLSEEIIRINFDVDNNAIPTNRTVKFITEVVDNDALHYFDGLVNKYKNISDIHSLYSFIDRGEKSRSEQNLRIVLYHEDILDEIHKTWEKLGGFLTFIYIPLAALIPFIIKSLRKYISNRRTI